MSNSNIPFYSQAAVVEQIAQDNINNCDPATISALMKALTERDDLRRHFFRSRPDISWVPALHKETFFSIPPAPVITDEGTILPLWDAQEYLASVAEAIPQEVLEHFVNLTVHPLYISRAMRMLTQLSENIQVAAIPKIITLLEKKDFIPYIISEAWHLVDHLASAKHEASFTLFETLLRPISNSNAVRTEHTWINDEAVSLGSEYHYHTDNFKKILLNLSEIDIERLVRLLETNLLQALQIETEISETTVKQSTWWRSAIEQSPQNFHHHYKDDLLDFLRDTAEDATALDKVRADTIVKRYLLSQQTILRRLGIHLLRCNHIKLGDLVEEELCRIENYEDYQLHHELTLLLATTFPTLQKQVQQLVVDTILNGPPEEQLNRIVEIYGGENPKHYRNLYTSHWILIRLWMIREQVTEETKVIIDQLVEQRGEPEHPAFLSWHSGFTSVSLSSPVQYDQICKYTPEELIKQLYSWQSEEHGIQEPIEISTAGLANAVAEAVLSRMDYYTPHLVELLSVNPTYSSTIIRQAQERIKGDVQHINSARIIIKASLALFLNDKIRTDNTRQSHGSWLDFRMALGWLIRDILNSDNVNTSDTEILDVLTMLVEDPDPDTSTDWPSEGWIDYRDPITAALNHVRPVALSGLIKWCGLCKKNEMGKPVPTYISQTIRDILTAKIEDASLAVHSVYGQYLVLLHSLDKDWLTLHLNQIFPTGDSEQERWRFTAAWDAYVVFNHMLHPDLFDALRSRYRRAIDLIAEGYISETHLQPLQRLVSHLLLDLQLQWEHENGQIWLGDTLLGLLLEQTSPENRGTVAWTIWRFLYDTKEQGKSYDDIWEIAVSIWRFRVDRAAGAGYPADYDQEMQWWSALLEFAPPSWSVEKLKPLVEATVHFAQPSGRRHGAWEHLENYLAANAKAEPQFAIDIYTRMYEQSNGPSWRIDEEVPFNLIQTLAENIETRKKALSLIDILGRRGDYRFREIYDHYA